MVQVNSRPNLIWIVLNDALRRKSKLTDCKQLIDENSNNEIISGNKKKCSDSTFTLPILVTHMVIIFLTVLPLRIT